MYSSFHMRGTDHCNYPGMAANYTVTTPLESSYTYIHMIRVIPFDEVEGGLNNFTVTHPLPPLFN